jgi:acetyl esterase/lipase
MRVAGALAWTLAASLAGAAPLENDLAYGEHAKQRLDLSTPSGKGFPTVVFFHGGSLTGGDKDDALYRDVCARFPAAGIACANVNYRLAPEHAWPAQAEDVAAAVAWVRDAAASRGGDPGKLFLLGHSSGAALVALVGSDGRYLARHRLRPKDLGGVVAMGSIMWDDELEQAIEAHGRPRVEAAFLKDPDNRIFGSLDAYLDHWPIRHVERGMPPFLLLVAESEQEQPPVRRTNEKFAADARAAGNQAECRVLSGRTHASAIQGLSARGDPVFATIRDFVRKAVAR